MLSVHLTSSVEAFSKCNVRQAFLFRLVIKAMQFDIGSVISNSLSAASLPVSINVSPLKTFSEENITEY